MGRLLWYSTVLALAAAIGGYIVLGPSDEDITLDLAQREAPAHVESGALTPATIEEEGLEYVVAKRVASLEGWRAFLAAHPKGAHAQAALAEIEKRFDTEKASAEASTSSLAAADNEQGYGQVLARRLEPLVSSPESASAKDDRLVLADKAPAPSKNGGSSNASPDAKTASDPLLAVLAPPEEAVPPGAAAAVSRDESRDAKGVDESVRHAAPPTGTDAVAGAQLAELAPAEVCQRDEDRLVQLRRNPSRDEATRFANELACERLRPQVLSLIERLPPTPTQDASKATPPGAQVESGKAYRALPSTGLDVASPASSGTCKRDEERLAQLGSNPSGDEALRFVKELGCESLLPQLQRLIHSPDSDASAPRVPADSSGPDSLLGQECMSERSALDRLRQNPSAEAAGLFWRDMDCEGLRPQVRLLLESLNVTPDSGGSATAPDEPKGRAAPFDTPIAVETNSAACQRETAELNRVRATPDFRDAKRFAGAVTCDALKPQVARLLASFGE
jgi:hypothetical protein